MKKKSTNPIRHFAKIIAKSNTLAIKDKVFLSIIVSSACKTSEAREYQVKEDINHQIILTIPINRTRKKQRKKEITIDYNLFNLKPTDYISYENKMHSTRQLQRISNETLNMTPREYRKHLAMYLLKKKDLAFIYNLLANSDLRTLTNYLKEEEVDFKELKNL